MILMIVLDLIILLGIKYILVKLNIIFLVFVIRVLFNLR